MLNIITGASGTGKTELIYKQIKELAEKDEKVCFIVPDQFSFETEQRIYHYVGPRSVGNIKVTGLSKISREILTKYGAAKEYADDIIKQVAMFTAVDQIKGSLSYYYTMAGKPNFVDFMLQTVGKIKSQGLSLKELRRVLNEEESFPEALSDKLSDVLMLTECYDKNLGDDISDKLDDLRIASKLARENNCFDGEYIFADGFDSFTGSQLMLIKEIIIRSKSFTVSFITDESGSWHFRCVDSLIAALVSYARENGTEVNRTSLTENFREKMRQNPSAEIYESRDIYNECDCVCSRIRQLAQSGIRYRDMLVLMGGNDYAIPLESAMEKYEIPVFMDVPSSVLTLPLISFIFYTLDALDFSTENILRYIKSGFVRIDDKPMSVQDIYMLEQFAVNCNLSRKEWLVPFPDNDKCKSAEALRKKIIEPLLELSENLKCTTGDIMTEKLCSFLIDRMCLEKTVIGLCKTGGQDLTLDKELNERYRQLWNIFVTVMESINTALEGKTVSLEKYTRILRFVFKRTDIAKPPQVIDAVTVGDMNRTRKYRSKAVFIMGVNEGLVPQPPKYSDFLTMDEAELLSSHNLKIENTSDENFSTSEFTVYKATNLHENKLILSYSLMGTDGGTRLRSHLIEDYIKEGIAVTDAAELPIEFYCRSKKAAEHILAMVYNTNSSEKRALLKAIDDKAFISRLEYAAKMKNEPDSYKKAISKEHAKAIFSAEEYSPTAIELLNSCEFKYFCRYGLGIKKPSDLNLSSGQIGSAVHFVLQYAMENAVNFAKADDDELSRLADGGLDKYYMTELMGSFGKTNRFDFLYRRIKRAVMKLLRQFRDELNYTEFIPSEFEKNVKKAFGNIIIKGKLDRMDLLDDDGKKYVRIVDYKTGSTVMNLSNLYYGLNLQMLLYLFTICDDFDGALIPSGVIYLPSAEGEIKKDTPSLSANAAEIATAKLTKPTGIFIQGKGCEDAEKLAGRYKSDYNINRFSACSTISEASYIKLKNHCMKTIDNKINNIRDGEIEALPTIGKQIAYTPCEYCEFGEICGNRSLEYVREFDDKKIYDILDELKPKNKKGEKQ